MHCVVAHRVHFDPLNLSAVLGDFTYKASGLHENVTIPGARSDDAQQAVPGSVQGHGYHIRLRESIGDSPRAFRLECVQLGGGAFVQTHHWQGSWDATGREAVRQDGTATFEPHAHDVTLGHSSSSLGFDPQQPHYCQGICRPSSSASKRKVGQWIDAQMSAAMVVIERGMKIRAVAKNFDIPVSTLVDHMNGRILQRKKGPPTVKRKN